MSKKPRTHKKKQKRDIRVEKTASAQIAIGEIEKGQDVFILTFGQFSLIDALIAILHQTGPADVIISTWTAAHAHLDKTADMMMDSRIRSLRMIVDRSFKTRQPKYFQHMIERFGADSIRETVTHAKAAARTKRNTPGGVVEILADKYSRLDDANDRLKKEGLVVRDQKGSVIDHPALKIAATLEKEIVEILKIYGT